MPVQINEIIIRVNVDSQSAETTADARLPESTENCSKGDAENMAEKILQIIREKNER